MSQIDYSKRFLWGVPKAEKPFKGFTRDQIVTRFAEDEFATVRVIIDGVKKRFYIHDDGDFWSLGPEVPPEKKP